MTKLILVEGIPGSGKTTTAQFIAKWLEARGFEIALFLEGDWAHPADFESVACLDSVEYQQIKTKFPQQADLLDGLAVIQSGEYFFSYRKIEHEHRDLVTPALIDTLARYEIYELPIDKFRHLLLQRWQAFAEHATKGNQIYIFECCYLQNLLTMCLGRNNETFESTKAFILEIAQRVKAINPCLIYLHPGDVEITLRRVAQTRSGEWLDFVIAYHTQQGYGKAQGWQGFNGLVNFYKMRHEIELELLDQMPFPFLSVRHSDWAQNYAEITAFLASVVKDRYSK